MSKGLTRDTVQLWRFLRADKDWWSVLRLTGQWAPTFTLREIEEHMVTLHRGGFVESQETERMGTVYAVTPACQPLPGYGLGDRCAQHSQAPLPTAESVARGIAAVRPGALDHMRHPSRFGETRVYHRSQP